jgi:hypothetical protein
MRKIMTLALLAGLVATSLSTTATAAGRKKPVKTTLYMHGTEAVGEVDLMANMEYLKLDAKKPKSATPKTVGITNYVAGPNDECAGNNLFPVFVGALRGKVKGTMKVTFFNAGGPGKIRVRIWPDVTGQLCNQETLGIHDYVKPAGDATIDALPGENTIVVKKVNFKALSALMIQFSPGAMVDVEGPRYIPPLVARIAYDSPDFATRVQFTCTPLRGKKCA